MDVNGKMTEAELLDADKARAIYEEIVRKTADPALLEYVGRDAFKVRIFPIEPNSRKQIKITYTQLLKSDTGLVEYTYPLNTEKFSARPLKDVSVKVNARVQGADQERLQPEPQRRDQARRRPQGDASATRRRTSGPDTDFKLIFSRTKSRVGVDLLTYRNAPDDGYFLLLASPGMDVADGEGAAAGHLLRHRHQRLDGRGRRQEDGAGEEGAVLLPRRTSTRATASRSSASPPRPRRSSTSSSPRTRRTSTRPRRSSQTLKPIGGTAIDDALRRR